MKLLPLLLLLASTAHAADFYYYNNPLGPVVIPLYSEETCRRELEELSLASIKNGLATLLSPQQSIKSANCIDEVLAQWSEIHPVESEPYSGEEAHPDYDPELLSGKGSSRQIVAGGLRTLLSHHPGTFDPKLRELKERLKCFNPYAPIDERHLRHQNSFLLKCRDWLSADEHADLKAEIDLRQQKVMDSIRAEGAARAEWALLLQQPDILSGVNLAKLAPLLDEFSFAKKSPAEKEETQRQIRKIIGGDLKELQAAYRAKAASIRDQRAKALARQSPGTAAAAGRRLLLIRYREFLRRGNQAGGAAGFCAQFARDLRNDRRFLQALPEFQENQVSKWRTTWDKAAKERGLSNPELRAIGTFSSNFYSRINQGLRAGNLSDDLKAYNETFLQGLRRLPPYRGTPVVRFATLPPDVLAQHRVGEKVCYAAYTSTSRKVNWTWSGETKFLIHPGNKARRIDSLSSFPNEEEVLFEAGTCFKVLAAEPSPLGGGKLDFVMAEVDDKGNVIANVPKGSKP